MDNNTTEKKEHFVGSSTLDSFTNIIQDDKASRINGAVALIKHLSNKKNEEGPSKEFQYSLKRLVRGLSASRDTSRIGFFTTLTTYLKLNQETKVDDLIQLMDVELKPNNSNAKSENANIHLGRILLCGALIKSKIVVNSEVVDQLKIVSTLLESGSKRSYLSFYSTSFLVELLNDYDSKTLKANIWPIIKKEIGKNWNEQSLDTLYIIFIMNDKFPKLVNTKFLNEYLDNDNIISIDTIDSLIKIVTDIPRIHYCHHPLYKILCEKLVASSCLDKFWSCIDKKFDKPSKTMEFLSLELLNILVPMINDKSIISSLISPNFIQYMLKRFNGSKKNRKDVIANLFRKFFSNIVVALNDKELSSKVPIDIIKKLIIYPGDLMIEKITGTKILQMITSNLNDKSVKKLSKVYHEIALNSLPKIINEKQENWINAERLYAGQLLTKLLGHSSVNNEHTWRLEQLKFLFNSGFCEMENIGVELASQYRDMFYRSLDHKLPKLDDLRDILTKLVDYINDNVIIEKNKILRTPMSDEAIEAWNKMITFIKKPESDFKNKHVVLIFFTMELSMGLHLFFDTELAISSINEIQSCSERLMTKKIINNKKNKKETTTNDTINGDEDEPEWVEVIVDLLLSLLSRNNHLLRSLGKCVFPHLCPELTSSSIHQILAVLDPKDERGPLVNKNFEEDDEDDDDDDSDNDSQSDDTDEDEDNDNEGEEEEEEEEDDDENQATSDDDDNVEEEEDDESDEDEDDDDDYDDEDETVTDRLKEALHQVLGASAQTDNDDNDDIDIDEIDEEEGKRLDAKLSAAFKILRQNRRNQKKKQKKTAEALTHFRVRVIDLLEIYIDCGPSMAIALDMLVPLFALLEFSIKDQHQKPLENRVRSCLKKLSNVKKFKDHDGVDETLISDMAKLLILKGERSTSICQEMGDKLAQCCTFLIRCTQQAGLPPSTLVDIYSENLTSFFKKRDCILSAVLFRSALQLSWTGTWQLIPSIIDFAFDNTTRSFRRGQALDLLTVFYHNHRMITSEEHQSLREKLEVKLYNYSLNWFKEFNESQLSTNDDKKNTCIGKEARQKFVCLLWTLLKAVHSRHIKKAWNWKKIGDAMVEYRKQVSLSNDAKSAYNKLAQAIGAPINIKTIIKNPTTPVTPAAAVAAIKTTENGDATANDKDNESDDEDDVDVDVDDKKKNKKNHKNKNDVKKQKKEAKQLRAKAMAKGFEDVHFVDLDILNGDNDNDDADDKQEENMEIQNGNNDNNETENIIDESNDDTSSKKRKSVTSSDDTPVKTKKKKKTQK